MNGRFCVFCCALLFFSRLWSAVLCSAEPLLCNIFACVVSRPSHERAVLPITLLLRGRCTAPYRHKRCLCVASKQQAVSAAHVAKQEAFKGLSFPPAECCFNVLSSVSVVATPHHTYSCRTDTHTTFTEVPTLTNFWEALLLFLPATTLFPWSPGTI